MATKKGMTPKRAERAAKVVKLIQSNATYAEAAKAQGISQTQAREDYKDFMRQTYAESIEDKVMKVEGQLGNLMRAFWPKALKGDVRAARIILDTIKSYKDLFGLDKALKLEVSGSSADDFADLLSVIRSRGD